MKLFSTGSDSGLIRPEFFDRQSLTAEDLNCLVAYIRDERRRHNRHVIGWGVSSGLTVRPQKAKPWELVVGAGHAIAPSGQEIHVPTRSGAFDICEAAAKCLDLPTPCNDPQDLTDKECVPGLPDLPPFAELPDQPGRPGLADLKGTDLVADFSTSDGLPPRANPVRLPFATMTARLQNGKILETLPFLDLQGQIGLQILMDTRIVFDAPVQTAAITLVYVTETPEILAFDSAGNRIDGQSLTVKPLTPQTLAFSGTDIREIRISSDRRDNIVQRIAIGRDAEPVGTVYLAICPQERATCFKPGVPEYCSAPGDTMKPARIAEGYRMDILCDLPDHAQHPDCDQIKSWLCEDSHLPAPHIPDNDCLVLAAIEVSQDGIVSIDEFTHRRRLPPLWMVAAQSACCCCGDTDSADPDKEPDGENDPKPFDRTKGLMLGLDRVKGVGLIRRAKLESADITNVTEFLDADPAMLAEVMGASLNQIAEFREIARLLTLDPTPIFDSEKAATLKVADLAIIAPDELDGLASVGVETLNDLLSADRRVLAQKMGVSLERVLKLQGAARLQAPGRPT